MIKDVLQENLDSEKNYDKEDRNFLEFFHSVMNLDTNQNTNITAILGFLTMPKSDEKTLVTNLIDPILNARTFLSSSI